LNTLLSIAAYLAGFTLVAWLCERYGPLAILGGLLMLVVVL